MKWLLRLSFYSKIHNPVVPEAYATPSMRVPGAAHGGVKRHARLTMVSGQARHIDLCVPMC